MALVDLKQMHQNMKPAKMMSRFMQETIFFLSLALFVYLFLVLFSYSLSDPGFDSSGTSGQKVQNIGGVTGANLASFFLYSFGVFGYLLPFGILLVSWFAFRVNQPLEIPWSRLGVRLLGLALWLVAGSGLTAIYACPGNAMALNCHMEEALFHLPHSGGGVIGYEVSRIFLHLMDRLATTLLLGVLVVMSITIMTGYSWLAMMDLTGFYLEQIFLNTKDQWKKSQIERAHKKEKSEKTLPSHKRVNVTGVAVGEKIKPQDHQAWWKFGLFKGKNPAETKKFVPQPASHLDRDVKLGDTSVVSQEDDPFDHLIVEAQQPWQDDDLPWDDDLPALEARKPSAPVQNAASAAGKSALTPIPVKAQNFTADNDDSLPTSYSHDQLPKLSLLADPPPQQPSYNEADLRDLGELLEKRLEEYGVRAQVQGIVAGPVVTRFEILPAPGVKVSQITNLSRDLARSLSVEAVRVVEVIPGKSFVGVEIPNKKRQMVDFKSIVSSESFRKSTSLLTLGLGRDISGDVVVADLAKMPHLLVAGTTGSGKSVGVNAMIMSMLLKATPDEVRFIMIDPKMLELSIYEGIPHLLTPVVTDMNDAQNALQWCVYEMDRRYRLLSSQNVRNIKSYNEKVQAAIDEGAPIIDPLYERAQSSGLLDMAEEAPILQPLPYIVVIIDEFADMMMVVGKKVEELIARLAQKARAAGMHLILATQRPSVNVVTGLIKANIPTRLSFQVSSKIDSRTILDQMGAEQLLGQGDSLYLPSGRPDPQRIHGAFVPDADVLAVVEDLKSKASPQYLEEITQGMGGEGGTALTNGSAEGDEAGLDPLFDEVVASVVDANKVSISAIQRRFKLGFNRAARIVDQMQAEGIVSAPVNGQRQILARKSDVNF